MVNGFIDDALIGDTIGVMVLFGAMSDSLLFVANLLCRAPTEVSRVEAAPQACFQRATNPLSAPWPAADNHGRFPQRFLLSGPQLYTQRLYALLQGQVYTSLKEGAIPRLWGNAASQPTYQQWQQLLRQEAYLAVKQRGDRPLGVLLGDSLSLWFPSDLLPPNKIWLNQGISGENTQQILARLDSLQGLPVDTIYLMAGVNDFKQGIAETVFLDNMRALIRGLRCQHPNATIVLQSLLPTNHDYLQGERVIRLNQQIQAIARQEGANYLNLYPLFAAANGTLRPELSTDGLHLSRTGYDIWQGAMQNLENCLNQN